MIQGDRPTEETEGRKQTAVSTDYTDSKKRRRQEGESSLSYPYLSIREIGLRDNTILIFQSDNGASAERNAIRVDNHKSGLPKLRQGGPDSHVRTED